MTTRILSPRVPRVARIGLALLLVGATWYAPRSTFFVYAITLALLVGVAALIVPKDRRWVIVPTYLGAAVWPTPYRSSMDANVATLPFASAPVLPHDGLEVGTADTTAAAVPDPRPRYAAAQQAAPQGERDAILRAAVDSGWRLRVVHSVTVHGDSAYVDFEMIPEPPPRPIVTYIPPWPPASPQQLQSVSVYHRLVVRRDGVWSAARRDSSNEARSTLLTPFPPPPPKVDTNTVTITRLSGPAADTASIMARAKEQSPKPNLARITQLVIVGDTATVTVFTQSIEQRLRFARTTVGWLVVPTLPDTKQR